MINAAIPGLLAGALWGLTFVAPYWAGDLSSGEIVVARYVVYGTASIGFLCWVRFNPFSRLGVRDWGRLAVLGALGNSLYYLLMVFSVRLGSAAATAMVVGTLPVFFAVAGNIRRPTVAWRQLLLALAPIVTGIALVAVPDITDPAGASQALGIILAIAAMASWLCYGLLNARYFEAPDAQSPSIWAALVGVGTLLTLPLVMLATLAGGTGRYRRQ